MEFVFFNVQKPEAVFPLLEVFREEKDQPFFLIEEEELTFVHVEDLPLYVNEACKVYVARVEPELSFMVIVLEELLDDVVENNWIAELES